MTDAVPADAPRDRERDDLREPPGGVAYNAADTLRRAIRAVARAERPVEQTRIDGAQRDVDRAARAAAREIRIAARAPQAEPDGDGTDTARQALRAAAERYARERRAAGDRPERMLVALKNELRATPADGQPPLERMRLAEAVVRWSIVAYYEPDSAA